jgi:hypothetical protein
MNEKDLDRRARNTAWIPRIERLVALRTWGFVAPTLCALMVIGLFRYISTQAAVVEITDLGRIVQEAAEQRHPGRCDLALEDLDPIVNDVVHSQHGALKEAPARAEIDARPRARALALTVANQLGRQIASQTDRCADPFVPFSQRVANELRLSFGLVMGLIAIVLGSLAGLFIADLYRARRDLRASGCFRHGKHASLEEEIAWERNWRTLEQPSQFFARRLGFSLLIAAGVNYILSPIGVQASIFGYGVGAVLRRSGRAGLAGGDRLLRLHRVLAPDAGRSGGASRPRRSDVHRAPEPRDRGLDPEPRAHRRDRRRAHLAGDHLPGRRIPEGGDRRHRQDGPDQGGADHER